MSSTVTLQDIFSHVLELPSISKVVQDLLKYIDDPRSNIDDIAAELHLDPALSAKVLRMANSVRYGAGRKVASIDTAVYNLGMDALRTLVVASGVVGAYKKVPLLDMKAYWRESFLVASVSRAIAKHAHLDAETAFTCGLMHKVGVPLLYMADAQTMDRIAALVKEGAHQEDLERNQFGFDHGEVGEELAIRWHFPETIAHAIGQHTRVAMEPDPDPYARVVCLARYIVGSHQQGASRHDIFDHFPAHIAEPLDLDLVALLEDLEQLMTAEDDIEEMLAA